MNRTTSVGTPRRMSAVVASILIALIAFLPSVACACLQTYAMSPPRMLLGAQLFGLLLIALVPNSNRAGWVTLGGLVIAGSWLMAMLTFGLTQSLVGAAIVLTSPIYLLLVIAKLRACAPSTRARL